MFIPLMLHYGLIGYLYRLISGGRDGCIRIWNYNNGHNLRTMMKGK